MEFTREEFDIMVDELLFRQPLSYTMLCSIAGRVLKKRVYAMCSANEDLRGRKQEEDVLQSVYIRLMNSVIFGFLLREGPEGPVNRDAEGFRAWMITVAKNIVKDEAKRIRRWEYRNTDIENVINKPGGTGGMQKQQEDAAALKTAVSAVLASKCSAYKMLTWMAFALFVHYYGLSPAEANRMVVEVFADLTLVEMYSVIRRIGRKADWITLSQAQEQRLFMLLDKPQDKERTFGQMPYRAFFMKKGDRETVSDWVSRMNTIARKELENAASVSQ